MISAITVITMEIDIATAKIVHIIINTNGTVTHNSINIEASVDAAIRNSKRSTPLPVNMYSDSVEHKYKTHSFHVLSLWCCFVCGGNFR